jgi:hypothetical protein
VKDLDAATLTLFEIVPLERLGLKEPENDIQRLVQALEKSGLEIIDYHASSGTYQFALNENSYFKQLVTTALPKEENELIWLLTDFFEYFFLQSTSHDLLFACTSTKNPKVGPDGNARPDQRDAGYISSEIGNPFYPPSLFRILCSAALKQQGFVELGGSIDCVSNLPTETAIAGSIFFLEPPLQYNLVLHDTSLDIIFRPLSVLSSNKLLSQEIVALLQEEASIPSIEIARAFPLFWSFSSTKKNWFTGSNHWWIRAKTGSQAELLQELLAVSLHLNWSEAKSYTEQLPKKLALSFGFNQLKRLRRLEERENGLRHSLGILQKRYPSRSDLIEWEANNTYSNIVRYSPLYLAWQTHLKAFVQGDSGIDSQFTLLVRQIDWASLEKLHIAAIDEAGIIVDLLQTDPGTLLTKIRVILEKCVLYLYQRRYSHATSARLYDMIQRLDRDHIFPPMISIYLTTLRTSGNMSAHTGGGAKEDIEALLPLFVRVLEWFLDEGVNKIWPVSVFLTEKYDVP